MKEVRLIDANAMREDWLENGENEFVYDTNAVLDSIDAQPTIDPESLRPHGKWTEDHRCTNCGEYALPALEEPDADYYYHTFYCPWCGTKMDLED